ncbi:MAG: hypothetical protein CVT67_07390 [Actinobacteria bacterium HGW-Actinobacteria-7]|jgi:vacuolar-type H+-ATPase subunit H|nr:MAG: hypothetical protein CVT67_07390 [Actinobacteria bacterium HGW-Actinobacteria-7]
MARRTRLKGASAPEEHENGSTLSQIREKELEYNGLVMVAQSEAKKRVFEAESQAEAAFRDAEDRAARLSVESETEAMASARAEADSLSAAALSQITHMQEVADARRRAVVDEVVRATLGG